MPELCGRTAPIVAELMDAAVDQVERLREVCARVRNRVYILNENERIPQPAAIWFLEQLDAALETRP